MPEPFGYGVYKQLMKLRGTKTFLSPQMYERDRLKAFEQALGLKPAPLKERLEKSGMEIRKARRLIK